jgi:hypothetical protein
MRMAEKRLIDLERRTAAADSRRKEIVIVRRIVGPDGKTIPAESYHDRAGNSWLRLVGENDEEFEARAIAAARQEASGHGVALHPTLGAINATD